MNRISRLVDSIDSRHGISRQTLLLSIIATASSLRADLHLNDDTLPPTICPLEFEFLQNHAYTCWLRSIDEGGITVIIDSTLIRKSFLAIHTSQLTETIKETTSAHFPTQLFSTSPNHFPNPQDPPFE
ncbi:hypothetical protein POPTR_019G132450v4 [Populus trichocarpa]|uniref:Uncharacterized protein n=1 Tax=Populus trichocarpa TaxID=3694 RepID=A0ACC0RLQ0_POPTR|nr:hypothetical protein BDE02_19G116100 [Populus trichocarpa]KAI9377867.1 hypothetical protein POPTR_019G132450v4 [Populus trichocarpa]